MKSFVALALAASAVALPQQTAGSDCEDTRDGSFAISVVNVTDSSSTKRGVERRQLAGILTLTLEGGVLKDQAGREGYIAANNQFQFDQPIQAGALETGGFEVCSNNTLALGGSAIWYQCYSGGFYNLYDASQGEQCNQIYIYAQPSSGSTASGAVSGISDGQPQATTQLSAPVSQLTDGQPQAPTSQATPVVTQLTDGQPQAPTSQAGPVVTQLTDGQIQAPTSQSAPLVTQLTDGQPQAPTEQPSSAPAGTTVVQISDGQPQAPVATGNYSSPNATASAPTEFEGAGTTPMAAAGALVAGLIAMMAML